MPLTFTPAKVADTHRRATGGDKIKFGEITALCDSHEALRAALEAVNKRADAIAEAHLRAAQERDALAARLQWQPRSTAPQDNDKFIAYGPALVDPDFNPDGCAEACSTGEGDFIGAVWNNEQDCWDTVPIEFTHWIRLAPPAPTGEDAAK